MVKVFLVTLLLLLTCLPTTAGDQGDIVRNLSEKVQEETELFFWKVRRGERYLLSLRETAGKSDREKIDFLIRELRRRRDEIKPIEDFAYLAASPILGTVFLGEEEAIQTLRKDLRRIKELQSETRIEER